MRYSIGVVIGITLVFSCLSVPAAAQAQDPEAPKKGFCFYSGPPSSCGSFLVTEANARYRVTTSVGGQSRFYLTGEAGWMKNRGERAALGGTGFFGYDFNGEISRVGIKARYRRWLGGSHRLDLSAGPMYTSAGEGGVGVVVGVDYGLHDAFLLSLELDYAPVERHIAFDCPSPIGAPCPATTSPTLYVGAGFGRKLGIASYGVALLAGLLAAGFKWN